MYNPFPPNTHTHTSPKHWKKRSLPFKAHTRNFLSCGCNLALMHWPNTFATCTYWFYKHSLVKKRTQYTCIHTFYVYTKCIHRYIINTLYIIYNRILILFFLIRGKNWEISLAVFSSFVHFNILFFSSLRKINREIVKKMHLTTTVEIKHFLCSPPKSWL